MHVTILGSTGALGRECLEQSLAAGHEVTVLVRTPSKLPVELLDRVRIVEGDALDPIAIGESLDGGVDAILFAIGVDKNSPEDLCADVTRILFDAMPARGVRRLVWCGGGSNLLPQDQITLGAKFVEFFASTFMGLRHRDKTHQLEWFDVHREIEWLGLRPLQMNAGKRRGTYRVGFDRFSGFSSISFGDCADAMLRMLTDDTWLHQAPIIQY
jgi:putative NADH-flavin reductase